MAKIAISLPDDVLEEIERERQATGETRSEFMRRAVDALLQRKREEELDRQYIRGYLELPETEEDLGGLYEAGLAALAQSPWDEDSQQ